MQFLYVLTILLVAVAVAPSLAHALEMPGKKRLTKDAYIATQAIYYPGFTVAGGIGEGGGMLATLLLTLLTPWGNAAFWLTLSAFLALLCMHGLYWLVTHPVNKFWLKDVALEGFGRGFFALGSGDGHPPADWTVLRDRWEHSHVARAALAMLSLTLLAAAPPQ